MTAQERLDAALAAMASADDPEYDIDPKADGMRIARDGDTYSWAELPEPRPRLLARVRPSGPVVSATACALLRHDVRPRWVGDLLAHWCHTCQPGHLLIPESASCGLGRNPPCDSARSSRPTDPATVSPLRRAVT